MVYYPISIPTQNRRACAHNYMVAVYCACKFWWAFFFLGFSFIVTHCGLVWQLVLACIWCGRGWLLRVSCPFHVIICCGSDHFFRKIQRRLLTSLICSIGQGWSLELSVSNHSMFHLYQFVSCSIWPIFPKTGLHRGPASPTYLSSSINCLILRISFLYSPQRWTHQTSFLATFLTPSCQQTCLSTVH